jgi:hypothetical protein
MWLAIAILGAVSFAIVALTRGEPHESPHFDVTSL